MLILPVQGAEYAVKNFPKKLNIISIGRDTPSIIRKGAKNHLLLNIDDLDFTNASHRELIPKNYTYRNLADFIKTLYKRTSYRFASKSDILRAIDFAKKYKVHIIHCGAGVSRSPAIAYAIFRSQGNSKSEALRKVMKLNPHALPNKWIVKLADEMFN